MTRGVRLASWSLVAGCLAAILPNAATPARAGMPGLKIPNSHMEALSWSDGTKEQEYAALVEAVARMFRCRMLVIKKPLVELFALVVACRMLRRPFSCKAHSASTTM